MEILETLNKLDIQDLLSARLRIETYEGDRYVFVDYRGLKEDAMINLAAQHTVLTLHTRLPFLADFTNTYVTPTYMRQVRKFVDATKDLMDKGALLGIDPIKAMILKGLVLFSGINYRSFDSREEALQFLLQNFTKKK